MTKISCPYTFSGIVFVLARLNQWNFCSVENLLGRNIAIKDLCLWYRWLSCCKLLGDLTVKLLNFCIIFLLPKKYQLNSCFLDRGEKNQNQPTKKNPRSLPIIFILLWEIGGIKNTFCPRLSIVFHQGLGLVLDKNTRNSIVNILE